MRRQQLTLIAQQAVAIATQLARNPANVVLVPHITELKHLRKLSNRKKPAEDPQTPTPNGTPKPPTPAPKVVE